MGERERAPKPGGTNTDRGAGTNTDRGAGSAARVTVPPNARDAGWGRSLHRAAVAFSTTAGSDRITYVEMDRLAASATETALHTSSKFLDMDLVRGSSMRKRWQRQRLNWRATLRVCFMPLHARHWAAQLGWAPTALLAAVWLLYASLLFSRFVARASVRLPLLPAPLLLWSTAADADNELVAPAALLIVLGLTFGGYAVEKHSVPVQFSQRRPQASNETDTDSSASDSESDSSDDDEGGDEGSPTASPSVSHPASPRAADPIPPLDLGAPAQGGLVSDSPAWRTAKPELSSIPSLLSRGAVRTTVWEAAKGDELRDMPFVVGESVQSKKYMDLQDIGRIISRRAGEQSINTQYFRTATLFVLIIVLGPLAFRLQPQLAELGAAVQRGESVPALCAALSAARASPQLGPTVVCLLAKAICTVGVFLHLAVAERCDSMRCLHAKYFGAITSRGKSRRIGLPHIRLHSVENVRMWIALRSHLRHQGPHTACNNIVSRTCVATLLLTLTTSVRFLEWSTERGGPAAACSSLDTDDPQTLATCAALFPAPVEVESATSGMFVLDSAANFELVAWSTALGFFSLRYIQIGMYLNNKYQKSVALMLSEQMHCHIRAHHKPHKRAELLCTIQVLKVGQKLLKELQGPHKISGMAMSPLLTSTFKLIVLSALSAVVSSAPAPTSAWLCRHS